MKAVLIKEPGDISLQNVDIPFTFFNAPEKLQENAAHLVNSVADVVHFML